MLVLSRKIGEQIVVGSNIVITVLEVQGQRVKIGIDAPRNCRVLRGELNHWNEEPTQPSPAAERMIAWLPTVAADMPMTVR